MPVVSLADLNAAVARVAQEGYAVQDTSTYDAGGSLHVLIGTRANGQDNRAFFFWQQTYLGNDAAYPSAQVMAVLQDPASNTITLRYGLYKPSDKDCCPTGGSADVRFRWNGTKLLALDYIPEPSSTAPLSRRSVGAPYVVRDYTERRTDGSVWQVRQWSDGRYESVQEISPSYTPTPPPTATPVQPASTMTATPNPLAFVVRSYYEDRPEGANCEAFHNVYQWSDGHYTLVCPKYAGTASDHLIVPHGSTRYYPLPFPGDATRIVVLINSDVAVRVTAPEKGYAFTTNTASNVVPIMSWVKSGDQIPAIRIENYWWFLTANVSLDITYDRSP